MGAGRGRWKSADRKWFDDINLDPSLRLAAGYGGEIVRRQQEKLVRATWDFAGEVEDANHVIASARLGAQSARKLHADVLTLSADRLIALSEPAHGRIRALTGWESFAAEVAGSAYEGFGRASRAMRRAARLRLGAKKADSPDFTAEADRRGAPFVPQGLPVLNAKSASGLAGHGL